jgi:hypothetical protein
VTTFRSTSRSVKMPTNRPPSTTSTQPTRRSFITSTAWRIDVVGVTRTGCLSVG